MGKSSPLSARPLAIDHWTLLRRDSAVSGQGVQPGLANGV